MTVSELKEMLKAFPDDMEIVTRSGNNSGASYAHSIRQWNAGDNPNNFSLEIPLILTEMQDGNWFGEETKTVLVIN